MANEPEILTGVSVDELDALAAGVLIPAAQSRMDDLLARNTEHRLSADEEAELDDLVRKVDHLNLLKARARYTIEHLGAKAST